MHTEFYFQSDNSNKVWNVTVKGSECTTSWGKTGAALRSKTKVANTPDEAAKLAEKLIKEKLNEGYLEGQPPAYVAPDWSTMEMNEEVFWRVIGLLNWKKLGDDDAVCAPAVKALSQMTRSHLEIFENILAKKLYDLDTEAHAREIGEDAYKDEESHFSVDWFLYTRCCVVANGKDCYEEILNNPKEMVKDGEFEAILNLARSANEKMTGEEDFDVDTDYSYETFSNREGWKIQGES